MSIALSLGNNLTTGGIFKPTAVNNTSVNNVTDFAGIAGGGTLVLLSTQTASASASISFTTGIDSTYDEYIFKFINMHPASGGIFTFNMSTDGGSTYAVTKTSTFFYSRQNESGSPAEISYEAGYDLAQSTSYQNLTDVFGGNSDDSCSGYLHLFAPSSDTYVKHFLATVNNTYSIQNFIAGYGNTTSAINAVDFKFSSGNTDDGIIKMYGVAKS
jgi:hypothetical protein